MAKFCGSCGAPLGDNSAFCIQCGTAQNATPQPPAQPPQTPTPAQNAYAQVNVSPAQVPPAQPGYTPVNAPPQYAPVNPGAPPSYPAVAKKSGSGLKIVIAILAVLFVGAVVVMGALFYVGHRVVNKIKAEAAEKGLSMPSGESSAGAASAVSHTDYCALLSKDDVGAAIGVPIVATRNSDEGCEYLAHGTSSDMTARHMSAIMAAKGADSQTQDKIHQMAGSFFKSEQEEHKEAASDANGNVPVVVFSIDTSGAREQMKLNSKLLGVLGPSGSTPISGIGDEAFDSAGAMMFVRKGDKLIRITYTTCPCNTEAIKPLARKLAEAI